MHLIQTAQDIAVPAQVGQWLAQHLPQATLDVIPAAGHLPHMTAADEVAQILARHLPGSAA